MFHRGFFIFFLFFLLATSRLSGRENSFGLTQLNFNSKTIETKKLLRPHPLLFKFRARVRNNKKYVAAALAFPFPFGIVGLHRIYLGCQPYVPVAYIGTVGGGFGVLPFIDFCAILSHKDIDTYVNNKKVFMWIN